MKKILTLMLSINIFNCSFLVNACQSKSKTNPIAVSTQIENKMKNYIKATSIKYVYKDKDNKDMFILQHGNDIFSIKKLNQKIHNYIFPNNIDYKSFFDTPILKQNQKWSWFFQIVSNTNNAKNSLNDFVKNIDSTYATEFKNNLLKPTSITTNYNGLFIQNSTLDKSKRYEIYFYYHINSIDNAIAQNFITNINNDNIKFNIDEWRKLIDTNKQGEKENLYPIIQKLWDEINKKLIGSWWGNKTLTFHYWEYKTNILFHFKNEFTKYATWNTWLNNLKNNNTILNFQLTSAILKSEYKDVQINVEKE